ncbi:hypothetical protein ACGFZU_43450 [Streptomyces tendae]
MTQSFHGIESLPNPERFRLARQESAQAVPEQKTDATWRYWKEAVPTP